MRGLICPAAGYINSRANAGYIPKRTIAMTKKYIGTNNFFGSLAFADFFGALAYK